MYFLQFTDCMKGSGVIEIPDAQTALQAFMEYNIGLFSGVDMNISIPGAQEDANIERVSLQYKSDLDIDGPSNIIAVAHFTCAADHHSAEAKQASAASRLILPKGVSLTK